MATVNDYTLSTTPTLIASGVGQVWLENLSGSTVDIFLGDASVTTSTGFRVTFANTFTWATGGPVSMALGSTDELYAVASGSPVLRVLRTR